MNEPTGYTALDFIGYTDKGDYSAVATYVKNDLVNYGGTKWRCLIDDTTAITPTEGLNWTVFVAIPADTTKQIIAPVEGATSLHAYAVGDQLIYNDILYKVISAIAVNDALVVGTNIQASDTVIEQVDDNKSDIQTLHAGWQKNGAYNICPNNATSQVIQGVTYTVKSDGTISASNTASSNSVLGVCEGIKFKAGTYKVVGTPTGGNYNTGYSIYVQRKSDYSTVATDAPNSGGLTPIFVADGNTEYNVLIMVRSGATSPANDFKPMITTDLNATYADYVPYAKTNRELTERVTETLTYDGVDYVFTRQGNFVDFYVNHTSGAKTFSTTSWINIGTLTKFRPSRTVRGSINLPASQNASLAFDISTSGVTRIIVSTTAFGVWLQGETMALYK